MCLSDWRIGRLIRSASQVQAISANSTFALPANNQRVAVLIVSDPAQAAGVSIEEHLSGALIGGSNLVAFPLLYSLTTHGDIPIRAIDVVNPNLTPITVGITEFFLPEDVIQAALQSLRSDYKL